MNRRISRFVTAHKRIRVGLALHLRPCPLRCCSAIICGVVSWETPPVVLAISLWSRRILLCKLDFLFGRLPSSLTSVQYPFLRCSASLDIVFIPLALMFSL